MRVGIGLGFTTPWKSGGAAVFDPSTLSLTGWWRASYSGAPWLGTASAGVSGDGSHDLVTIGADPSVGTSIDGVTPADLDGTNDLLAPEGTLDDYINENSYSGWVIFYADAAAADNPTYPYLLPAFMAENSGSWGVTFSSAGFGLFQNTSGGYKYVATACATAGWHVGFFKCDGTNIYVAVDDGAWQSVSAPNGTVTPGARTSRFGTNYNQTAYFNGLVMEMAVTDGVLSDDDKANIYGSYAAATYPNALGLS